MSANIDIKKIIEQNQTAVLVVAAILTMLLIYVIFLAPITNKMGLIYQEYRACTTQVSGAQNLIEMGYKIDKEHGSRTLISEQEAAIAIEEFTRYSKSLGINFIEIKPLDIVKSDKALYKILPVELSFEASGEQFLKFIGSIDELKKAIVTVKSFDITPDKADRNKLNIDMVINIYLSDEEGDR